MKIQVSLLVYFMPYSILNWLLSCLSHVCCIAVVISLVYPMLNICPVHSNVVLLMHRSSKALFALQAAL